MLVRLALLLALPVCTWAADLQPLLDKAVAETFQEFADKKLQSNQLAVTWTKLTDDAPSLTASYHGEAPIYPASVVKLFYLVAAHQWMEEGKIQDSDELRRAMRDMIVDSYNEATHYVVDTVTSTTAGPELSPDAMRDWEYKRNVVNRWFAAKGYKGINVNQKPWCEGPYGRERVFVGKTFQNRNALTSEATATLLANIARGALVSRKHCEEMMELLKRDPFKKGNEQATDYIGKAVPAGTKLWSKAGWTSTARHDAAYVELPNGNKLVLVIFTTGHSEDKQIIPALARRIFDATN
ncbi:MAG TPA: serine hydrolase [Candidatus Binatia bacterium]|nr:serine hydrolase [Candidatus Binatia bacterium]